MKSFANGHLHSLLTLATFLCCSALFPQPSKAASDVIFVGTTNTGLFKSTDGGLTWSALNNLNVTVLTVDPTQDGVLYGAAGGSAYKSEDGGVNWTGVNNGLPPAGVQAFIVHPSNPDIIYAGLSNFFSNGGIFKSANGGASWSAMNSGLPTIGITVLADLAMHPAQPETLYFTNAYTLKTTDGGENWFPLAVGGAGWDLAIDPARPDTVYADGPFSSWAMFKSNDGGLSWDNITPSDLGVVFAFRLAIDPNVSSTVYAAVRRSCSAPGGVCGSILKSVDGGATWSVSLEREGGDPLVLAIDPADPSILYAAGQTFGFGQSFGFFRTVNGGANWTSLESQFPDANIATVVFAPPAFFTQFQTAAAMLEALGDSTNLTSGQINSLVTKLENAWSWLVRNPKVACNQLRAFLQQLSSLVEEGVLTPGSAGPLISLIEGIRHAIPCAG